MHVSMVVAHGPKGEIGLGNKLLWHIPEDLKNFKKLTVGKMIVMGRKTYESIGRPLPDRANVVITRDTTFKPDGVIVIHDPMMAFDLALEAESDLEVDDFEMVVIGGGEIFNFFLPYTQKIYLSEVPYEGPADAFFPPVDYKEWEVLKKEEFKDFTFKILDRI
ncbi:dihydrofolate reductase [Bacteriovorax stolpii]|nr:dihydrofolate reductase [Bacteriovorax stolpii]TDP52208.1 dihydrofolate reductase [Bacteriovorax stolpii]BDT28395.1 dihydrofolate reductase [Bacteriovorax sp. HI3]